MTDSAKQGLAAILLLAAIVLGVVAYAMWAPADHDAEMKNGANAIETTLDGVVHDTVKPNHTASYACAGGAAVTFLGCMILVAGAQAAPASSKKKFKA